MCVLALSGIALAGCASSGPFASRNSHYSPRVVADGEPVPKGGGTYKVGQPYRLNGKTYYPSDNPRYRAEGVASWYGPDFHGRLTANGEVFDMDSISAAHPTMPLPSYARVTNLDNGRSIVVRVNDRGPYARGRVMDLSIGAAKALDFYKRGLAHVRVEYVGRAPMEGSDDRQLMATLRQGRPAPAPSSVQVAALTPLSPLIGPWHAPAPLVEDDEASMVGGTPVPVQRPHRPEKSKSLTRTATAKAGTTKSDTSDHRRVALRGTQPSDHVRLSEQLSIPAPSASAFAPMSDQGSLALMSGRGLY